LKKSTLLIFAIAGGFAVGNLYFIQPLLAAISADLGTSASQNGLLVTAVQLGYASGIVFLLPLGDVRSRKIFVPVMVTLAGLGQIAVGASTSYLTLIIALFLVGFTTISGQILIPLTNELSDESHRGRNVSFVVSGILIGILGARTISGGLSDLTSWQVTFGIIGLANLALALALYRSIPVLDTKPKVAYHRLVAGIFSLIAKHRWVLRVMISNGIGMLIFSSVWTSLTFLLSGPRFKMSTTEIGLWGLFGLVGAIGARNTGRLIDSGKAEIATKIAWIANSAAMVIGSFAEVSLIFLAIQLFVMDAAFQAIGVTNQTKLISSFPEARSRINAGYVTVNFIGAALGSAFTAILWSTLGWAGIQWIGAILALIGLLLSIRNTKINH
jgi:predicted MFS family arabinose efflux permease